LNPRRLTESPYLSVLTGRARLASTPSLFGFIPERHSIELNGRSLSFFVGLFIQKTGSHFLESAPAYHIITLLMDIHGRQSQPSFRLP
jgi:hypothetical protein